VRGLRRETSAATDSAQWRAACLRRGGCSAELAARLAEDRGYDLHALLELLDRGCPPPLAARILAPLDRGDRAC
jgi:hypothetical protein